MTVSPADQAVRRRSVLLGAVDVWPVNDPQRQSDRIGFDREAAGVDASTVQRHLAVLRPARAGGGDARSTCGARLEMLPDLLERCVSEHLLSAVGLLRVPQQGRRGRKRTTRSSASTGTPRSSVPT